MALPRGGHHPDPVLRDDGQGRAGERWLVPGLLEPVHVGLSGHRPVRLAVRRGRRPGHPHHGHQHRGRWREGAPHQDQELDLGHLLRGSGHLRPDHRHRAVRPAGAVLHGDGPVADGHPEHELVLRLPHLRRRPGRRSGQPLLRYRCRHRRIGSRPLGRSQRRPLRQDPHRGDLRLGHRSVRPHRGHLHDLQVQDGRQGVGAVVSHSVLPHFITTKINNHQSSTSRHSPIPKQARTTPVLALFWKLRPITIVTACRRLHQETTSDQPKRFKLGL